MACDFINLHSEFNTYSPLKYLALVGYPTEVVHLD